METGKSHAIVKHLVTFGIVLAAVVVANVVVTPYFAKKKAA